MGGVAETQHTTDKQQTYISNQTTTTNTKDVHVQLIKQTHICMYTCNMYMYTCIGVCVCVYIYIYAYIHTYMYTYN